MGHHEKTWESIQVVGPAHLQWTFKYNDVGLVVLRSCFECSRSYQTGTCIGETGAERKKRFYEYCVMPCSFSYLKLLLQ